MKSKENVGTSVTARLPVAKMFRGPALSGQTPAS